MILINAIALLAMRELMKCAQPASLVITNLPLIMLCVLSAQQILERCIIPVPLFLIACAQLVTVVLMAPTTVKYAITTIINLISQMTTALPAQAIQLPSPLARIPLMIASVLKDMNSPVATLAQAAKRIIIKTPLQTATVLRAQQLLSPLVEAQTFTIAPALLDMSGFQTTAQPVLLITTKVLLEIHCVRRAHLIQGPIQLQMTIYQVAFVIKGTKVPRATAMPVSLVFTRIRWPVLIVPLALKTQQQQQWHKSLFLIAFVFLDIS